MHLVLFTHPSFSSSMSMPRFAKMVANGMRARGHDVEIWTAKPFFSNLPAPRSMKKWLGYIDQLVIFPVKVRAKLKKCPPDTLFVFADQALGPWIPLVAKRPHVIHCNDFLALRAALGEFSHKSVSWTGRLYQRLIRKGFSKGHNFVSISKNTERDLLRLIRTSPRSSTVVYLGLNYPFKPLSVEVARNKLVKAGLEVSDSGFLVHVGGNYWYKNRSGVLSIYDAYCTMAANPLPLWMIGDKPNGALLAQAKQLAKSRNVYFLDGLDNELVHAAYALASALIFPSLAEGFGWPIAEAMACGCPVLTTGEAPMTEVGGEAACYIPPMPIDEKEQAAWAERSALKLSELLNENGNQRDIRREAGFKQGLRFDTNQCIETYESIYEEVLAEGATLGTDVR